MSPWISSLLAISIVSGIPLAVTFLLAKQARVVRRIVPQLTAMGAGALLGAATMHLIPEALSAGRTPLAVFAGVVAGYLAFALVERLLASHDHAHAHGLELGAPESPNAMARATRASSGSGSARANEHAHQHAHGHSHQHSHHDQDHDHARKASAALIPLAFTGDAIHNLVDGMLIAAGFLTNPGFGFLTALAIGLHELPREVGTFGLFVHGGVHPMRAVAYNLVTALISFVGAAATLLIGSHMARLGENILPFAAGSYLYIAVAVGIPSLARHRDGSPRASRAAFLVGGFVLMGVSALIR
ncbi:MAG: ZIP family metal transporter [Gemmatimonadaceae bacterium]